jgi:hypothetical protein
MGCLSVATVNSAALHDPLIGYRHAADRIACAMSLAVQIRQHKHIKEME